MCYYLYDVRGQLGQCATNYGWRLFAAWADTQPGEPLATFIEDGWTDHPQGLVAQLELLTGPDAGIEEIRHAIIALARNADDILILNQGLEADPEPV